MRGRVISYFAMAFFGMLPLGALMIGGLSKLIGAPNTILAEGIAALVVFGVFYYLMQQYMIKKKKEEESDTDDALIENI